VHHPRIGVVAAEQGREGGVGRLPVQGPLVSCDGVDIVERLGGGQVYRARGPGGLGLWKYRDVQTGWSQHYFVVHNDRAYDAWTGRHGEPFDEYMAQWEDASETVELTRGTLFWDPDLNGFRFRETG
jgi:hypothetical protein